MYPDWLSLTGEGYVAEMYKKYGRVVSPMGCRAFLSPWFERGGYEPADEDDKPIFVGRFNIGAISLHLPMIYAKAKQEGKDFWEVLDYYMENAKVIRESLTDMGLEVYGGISSPYIWVKTPNDMDSWDFFDILLNEANVIGTPGSGFGPSGEGYLRLTAFNTLENTKEAMDRISKLEF